MDKSGKLQRYHRKDYTELVEFPVEIVGRDGVVRRYTFEDSIRLYQRRVTFAPLRYRDTELVRAEVEHCKSRIEQLRRSYFHKFGWGTPDGEIGALEVFGDLAGELAAFLCRVLRSEGRPEVQLDAVEAEALGSSTWYLRPAPGALERIPEGLLLYVHRFEGVSADSSRERFFGRLKELERHGRNEGDGERLLAFHHTVDCAFVLTGRGQDIEKLGDWLNDDEAWPEVAATPWDRILEHLKRGESETALQLCRDLVKQHPWHRSAYTAGAMLALSLQQLVDAEEFAVLGTRFFPQDPLLSYYLGAAQWRQGRHAEAAEQLRVALEGSPDLSAARLGLVILSLQRGRFGEARSLLDEGDLRHDDRRLEFEFRRLSQWLAWRWPYAVLGLLSLVLGVTTAPIIGWISALPLVFGALLLGGGWWVLSRHLTDLADRQRFEEVSMGLRRLAARQERQKVT